MVRKRRLRRVPLGMRIMMLTTPSPPSSGSGGSDACLLLMVRSSLHTAGLGICS